MGLQGDSLGDSKGAQGNSKWGPRGFKGVPRGFNCLLDFYISLAFRRGFQEGSLDKVHRTSGEKSNADIMVTAVYTHTVKDTFCPLCWQGQNCALRPVTLCLTSLIRLGNCSVLVRGTTVDDRFVVAVITEIKNVKY